MQTIVNEKKARNNKAKKELIDLLETTEIK
jgi:hypothetical protein